MKKIIYIFIILFAFCSCAKDYPQQVKDRVEQYQKEGKKVLSHSDDPTGKEHYIVFADVKAQIIGGRHIRRNCQGDSSWRKTDSWF